MPPRNAIHQIHQQLVVVNRDVDFLKNRREFILARRDFVVPRPNGDAQSMAFRFEVAHKRINALWNRAKIMVFELLMLRRDLPDERPTRHREVRPSVEKGFINHKILLFPTERRLNFSDFFIKKLPNGHARFVQNGLRTKQRQLKILRVA